MSSSETNYQSNTGSTAPQQSTQGGGDLLDKGVEFAERQAGYEQVCRYACICSL
jgi:hypothetical protein